MNGIPEVPMCEGVQNANPIILIEKKPKSMTKTAIRNRRYRKKNRERLLKEGKEYRKTEKYREYRDKNKSTKNEYNKQYHQDHKERLAEKDRLYHEAHRVEKAAYYQENKEYKMATRSAYLKTRKGKSSKKRATQKRRAAMAGVISEYFDPIEVLVRDGYICQLCGKKTRPDFKNSYHPLYPNLDHIIPLNLGGVNTKENTQCLCRGCNVKKGYTGTGDQLRMFG